MMSGSGAAAKRCVELAPEFAKGYFRLATALHGLDEHARAARVAREGLLHAGVLVPMRWLLGPVLGYGLLGCWAGGSVYVLGLALSMTLRFAGKSWREIKL